MLQLEIENSWTYFDSVSLSDSVVDDIGTALSYEIPGSYFIQGLPWYAKYKKLLKKKPRQSQYKLPTGLIYLVEEVLKQNNIEYQLIDCRKIPTSTKYFNYIVKPPPLRYYQIEAVEAFLEKKRGVIEAATGSGKSICIVEIIKRLSLTTILIVPNRNILNQFYGVLLKYFGKRMVGKVGDGKKEINKEITVGTYQSLCKLDQSFFDKINLAIIDESHHSAGRTISDMYLDPLSSVYYRLGTTATYLRSSTDILELFGVCQNIIYEYPASKAIKDKVICQPTIAFITVDNISNLIYLDWRAEEKQYILDNDIFHNKVAKIANYILSQNIPTIVFIDQILHGEKLNKLIPNSMFLHGKNENNHELLQDFNDGKIKCLIGTAVLAEGIDTIVAGCGIIACGGRSEIETIQRVGRILRVAPNKDKALIIDFMHNGTKYLLRHGKIRHKIYEEIYGKDNIVINPSNLINLP